MGRRRNVSLRLQHQSPLPALSGYSQGQLTEFLTRTFDASQSGRQRLTARRRRCLAWARVCCFALIWPRRKGHPVCESVRRVAVVARSDPPGLVIPGTDRIPANDGSAVRLASVDGNDPAAVTGRPIHDPPAPHRSILGSSDLGTLNAGSGQTVRWARLKSFVARQLGWALKPLSDLIASGQRF